MLPNTGYGNCFFIFLGCVSRLVWMVEVETEAFLNDTLDTYHVVTNILDNMMDTVNAHDVVRNILFDIINTITTLS